MLPSALIEQIKQQLLSDKVRLENELNVLATEDPKQPGHYVPKYEESGGDSEDDNSQEVTTYVDEMSLVGRLSNELGDVVKALEALERGDYGTCRYCGKEIDQKRFEARPTSSSCISCKKLLTQEI